MNENSIFYVALTVIGSLGGGGAIVWALSAHLGKMWATRYFEKIKFDYQKEIESYKYQLELIKERTSRYTTQQFDLYNKLYNSLYELKKKADNLWEVADSRNLSAFSKQLGLTKEEVERNYLFIEEMHYNELMQLILEFSNYKIGKGNLIDIYKRGNVNITQELKMQIGHLIGENRTRKQQYDILIGIIRQELKKQLKGSA